MISEHLGKPAAARLGGALIGASAIVFALALAFALLAQPTGDDFCRAAWPMQNETVLAHVAAQYQGWSGRWAAMGIYALTFWRLGIDSWSYNALILLSPLIWFATFFTTLHIIYRRAMTAREKALLALVLLTVFWAGAPDLGQTWYWLTGSVENQLPVLLLVLCLLALTSSWATEKSAARKLAACAIAAVLALLVTGLHEFAGLLLFGACGIGLLIALARARWDMAALFAATLVVVAIGLGVNLSAPGTATRAATDFPNAGNLYLAVRFTLLDPHVSPYPWLFDARLLSLSALLLTSPWFLAKRPAWLDWKLPLPRALAHWALVIPAVGLVTLFGALFAVDFAQGAAPPGRVLTVIYAALMLAWIAALAAIARHAAPSRIIHITAAILLPFTLLTAPNSLRALTEVRDAISEWRPAVEARDAQMRAAAANGQQAVAVTPITNFPELYFWRDLSSDPSDWRNDCFARYFHVQSVSVLAPSSQP